MGPDLAKKFHDQGATDAVIEALTRASEKRSKAAASAATSAHPAAQAGAPPPASLGPPPKETVGEIPPIRRPQPSVAAPQAAAPAATQTQQAPAERTAESESAAAPAMKAEAKRPAPPPAKKLTDPSPEQIQQIIQAFAAKEALFKQARDNYTYHQINKVEELGPDSQVQGTWRQDWDILYDDSGKRIEQVTYAPVSTMPDVQVTQQDIDSMRTLQPFVLTTEALPEYDIKYLGHVPVDYLTTYVFSVRPKEIKKGQYYFKGIVWVDDRDLQIVKAQGRMVPEDRKGQNLFPPFTTYRQQIDGKFWFPTFTIADDTLYFASGPVHIKEIVRYTDYKQFKSTSTIKMVKEDSPGQNPKPAQNPPPKN
jgi:hypothetical protein